MRNIIDVTRTLYTKVLCSAKKQKKQQLETEKQNYKRRALHTLSPSADIILCFVALMHKDIFKPQNLGMHINNKGVVTKVVFKFSTTLVKTVVEEVLSSFKDKEVMTYCLLFFFFFFLQRELVKV